MKSATPFFTGFSALLFGKPPVSALKEALAKLAQCNSLSQMRQLFGSCIPDALLAPEKEGDNSRRRIFSQALTFWAFLDQVQTPNGSCREAVRKVMAFRRRKFPKETLAAMSPDTSAYCQSRLKISLDTIKKIGTHLVERMQKNIPLRNLWHGRQVKVVDGTGISMPDTTANQSRWPQSASQKRGCGFPMMNLVAIFCLTTGALIKAASGERKTHESLLFKELWGTLEKGDLVVTDRGFCSFGTVANLLLCKVDTLMRLPENKIRRAIGAQLPKSESFDVIIEWKCPAQRIPSMTQEEFSVLRHFANATQGVEEKPRPLAALVDEMLLAMVRDLNPYRPNRSEPRVKKRRPKNYRLLTKPRHEMGNLPHRKIGVENLRKPALT
jgi:hypothetical protein